MAYRVQAAFGAGELDPALRERTTLDKFNTGLATARNIIIGKTGRLISRAGRYYFIDPKEQDTKHIIYAPSYSDYLFEVGEGYIRTHDIVNGGYTECETSYTEADLEQMQLLANNERLLIMVKGEWLQWIEFTDLSTLNIENYHFRPAKPTQSGFATVSGTGYQVDYAFTIVNNGVESFPLELSDVSYKLPINPTESNFFAIIVPSGYTDGNKTTELRMYRRPSGGGEYGYIGSAYGITELFGAYVFGAIYDRGQDADFSRIVPDYNYDLKEDSGLPVIGFTAPDFDPKTGCYHQQRLVLSGTTDESIVVASRTKRYRTFTEDIPVTNSSSLIFKIPNDGNPKILRLFDGGRLLAFTTLGLFASDLGPLTPDNIGMDNKGEWVIDEIVPPLKIPGAIIFVDKNTRAIVALNYNDIETSFLGQELSIYSAHLFEKKRIVSWAFQDGILPCVYCVMDDGSLNVLTYQREQLMQAWTHFDSSALYESVTAFRNSNGENKIYFSMNRDGVRTIEYQAPRYVDDFKEYVGVDSAVVFNGKMEDFTFYLTPDDPDDWEQELTLTSDQEDAFTDTAENGAVGTIFKFFDSDGAGYELEVTQFIDDQNVKVLANALNAQEQLEDENITLYKTKNIITGLSHLEGEEVSVKVDGYIFSSPLNTIQEYDTITVSGGQIQLPGALVGAIVVVGLPYVWDIETLDVATVEQKPILLESKTVNKLYIQKYNSRAFYASNTFPEDDTNTGMEEVGRITDDGTEILGNAAEEPETVREEVTLTGDWASNGRVCLRGVDPDPVEILSIIPDLDTSSINE